MNRAFSVPHPKHAQPSCPAPYTRLVLVPSDQAFPTLQQLLTLPSSYPFTPASSPPFTPALRSSVRFFIRTNRPWSFHSVRIVHGFFIPYESLSVRIVHDFFVLYESLSVRIVIRLHMSTSPSLSGLFFWRCPVLLIK